MICEECLCEIDEETEDIFECIQCGMLVCDDCVTTDGLCVECDSCFRLHYNIFSP